MNPKLTLYSGEPSVSVGQPAPFGSLFSILHINSPSSKGSIAFASPLLLHELIAIVTFFLFNMKFCDCELNDDDSLSGGISLCFFFGFSEDKLLGRCLGGSFGEGKEI